MEYDDGQKWEAIWRIGRRRRKCSRGIRSKSRRGRGGNGSSKGSGRASKGSSKISSRGSEGGSKGDGASSRDRADNPACLHSVLQGPSNRKSSPDQALFSCDS